MERIMKDASFLAVVRTVLAGLVGVRRREDHERESVRIKPLHVIAAALIGAVLFILTLLSIVRIVVAS